MATPAANQLVDHINRLQPKQESCREISSGVHIYGSLYLFKHSFRQNIRRTRYPWLNLRFYVDAVHPVAIMVPGRTSLIHKLERISVKGIAAVTWFEVRLLGVGTMVDAASIDNNQDASAPEASIETGRGCLGLVLEQSGEALDLGRIGRVIKDQRGDNTPLLRQRDPDPRRPCQVWPLASDNKTAMNGKQRCRYFIPV